MGAHIASIRVVCVILCFFFHFKVRGGGISIIFWESKPI